MLLFTIKFITKVIKGYFKLYAIIKVKVYKVTKSLG